MKLAGEMAGTSNIWENLFFEQIDKVAKKALHRLMIHRRALFVVSS
jgi:hypothetical protein